MKHISLIAFIALYLCSSSVSAQREDMLESIESRADEAWSISQKIWAWAEPGYQETQSSALLAKTLRKAGFEIEEGVADIPTAFTATYGSGKPVIGILGEFDALPGLSQQAVPERALRNGATYGHGCGHHLFGTASAYAAIAISQQIKAGNMQGTVRFYGSPAEEGGGAKVYMVREGLFNDCDAVLHWHPASANGAGDPSNLSRIAAKFRFHGKSAHAAGAPEQGRSALDAVELTNHAAQLLREHTPDFTRIHHVITAGGDAPNVVPNFAEVYFYVRHPDASVVTELYRRLRLCAEAGALATETKLEIEFLGGTHNILPNDTLSKLTLRNLKDLARLEWTPEEIAFAKKIQETLSAPEPIESIAEVKDRSGEISKGSTDVGDVSWAAPTTGFGTACWAPGTPAHSWQATACGGHTMARDGMILATQVLAATAWDLSHDPETLIAARAELNERLGKHSYDVMLEPGQKPPLNYRNPPKKN